MKEFLNISSDIYRYKINVDKVLINLESQQKSEKEMVSIHIVISHIKCSWYLCTW